MTRSEELVFRLCRRSFLSMWSYANPRGKKTKELCDVLVVCDPDVIIFSVKEIQGKESGDPAVGWARWTREAIHASVKQIYGAERWLRSATHAYTRDGAEGLPLPDLSTRRVHRIAVALGSGGMIPMTQEDFGKGFVHVLEEGSLDILLGELDTITDFTAYLTSKEELLERAMVIVPGEENLLAEYLQHGRSFGEKDGIVAVDEDEWERFASSEAFGAKQRADRASRSFDWIIETFAKQALAGELEPGPTLSETELLLRSMVRETRFNRRLLGKSFTGFYERAAKHDGELARMLRSPSGTVYVYLASPRDFPRHARKEGTRPALLRCPWNASGFGNGCRDRDREARGKAGILP